MPPAKNVKAPPEPGPWAWADKTDLAEIGQSELIKAYRLDAKECPYACRRNCKKNPLCFWGLGDRNWRKQEKSDEERERNPNRDDGQLIGIQNLGATCYVNSLLQLWYHNPIIRPAILSWKPPQSVLDNLSKENLYTPHCAVSHLQAMFARLKRSKQSAIDPRSFVNALELDDQVQQDAQEFSKLLMACIMKLLEESNENKNICSTFKDCFTGQSQFETVCDNCLTRRVGQKEDFNELQLPVLKHVHLSFKEYLNPDRLEKENKYFCPTCNSKQDATRSMKLVSLPPVLNLQLMRFVYSEHGERKKVIKSIEFPEILDMTEFAESQVGDDKEKFLYQLNAVLIHNGRKVSSGHYIAHIKDSGSGGWFECNDDSIQKIDRKGYSKTLIMKDDDEEGTGTSTEPKDKKKSPSPNPSSNGAYMLVYTRCKVFRERGPDPEIPPYLSDLIDDEDVKFEEEFTRTKAEKESEVRRKSERQSEVDSFFAHRYPPESDAEEEDEKPVKKKKTEEENGIPRVPLKLPTCITVREVNQNQVEPMETDEGGPTDQAGPKTEHALDFIAVDWLEKWLNAEIKNPPEIPNTAIRCAHGKLSPPKRSDVNVSYKAVPLDFADRVYAKYGGNRLSGEEALCLSCVQVHCGMIQELRKLEADWQRVMTLVKESDGASEQAEVYLDDKVWIGKDSLRRWKKYARNEIEKADADDCQEVLSHWTFNEDIQCDHGQLDPNSVSNRKLIPLTAWSIITNYFSNADTYGYRREACKKCLDNNELNSAVKDQNKTLANKQKQGLAQLLSGKNRPVETEFGRHYIVPTEFVNEWRQFIKDPVNNDSVAHIKTDELLCGSDERCGCAEPGLKYPLEVVQKAREIDAENGNIITLLREEEFKFFQECATTMDTELTVTVGYENSGTGYTYNVGICQRSADQWLSDISEKAFEYIEGNIYVKKVDEEEEDFLGAGNGLENEEPVPPKKDRKETAEPAINSNSIASNVRRSARARHNRNENRYRYISSTTRISDFQKNHLLKDYKAMLSDQHLYLNNRELTETEKSMTFGQLKIHSGATLILKVDQPKGKEDDMETDTVTQAERGFLGTVLASSYTSPSASSTSIATNGVSA